MIINYKIVSTQENMLTIDAHNQGYLDGSETFFTRINTFGDLTFDEFAQVVFLLNFGLTMAISSLELAIKLDCCRPELDRAN